MVAGVADRAWPENLEQDEGDDRLSSGIEYNQAAAASTTVFFRAGLWISAWNPGLRGVRRGTRGAGTRDESRSASTHSSRRSWGSWGLRSRIRAGDQREGLADLGDVRPGELTDGLSVVQEDQVRPEFHPE